ncbi:MAG TPA: demethoxyubiquinone hydroxylase family protein [Brevundimonas sp.]|jgi:ubiquinone biosynthesis monooxygenase Coq7|uniref:demethoxyubiquinone hydroxylase family protein n=1 Tax=Brevundimonas sp. TaxID=1871086 RepID=UPI002DF255CA|nr:demethoxyubiquinone hydroxylase family protein [Brevundimonas sp.]
MASTVARILKVNHGGEHGAVRIYAAQIALARVRCPHLVAQLAELLEHERRHEKLFRSLMPARQARPCRLMWLWGVGGAALGLMTGALGTSGVFACTRAVERTVHRHLSEQLAWLRGAAGGTDAELIAAIAGVQTEEEGHLEWADRGGRPSPVLDAAVAATVDALIWMSTQGESARLARQFVGR